MEKININYPEEKVLRLFTIERKPLTTDQLLDYLKSLDFGGGQYILQGLVKKKLLHSKTMSNGALLFHPTPQTYYYYAKSGGLRDDSIAVDNTELRRMTLLLEQLDTVEEAKKSVSELKLAKQRHVIELWQIVDQCNACSVDQQSNNQPNDDEEELDSNAMIIEVKDSDACAVDELDAHPELQALTERKIELLHRYNEIKDFAHALLGVLAEEQLTTAKQLYSVFNIEP